MARQQIAAYRAEHGAAYVGRINHYGTERQHIISGEQSPIEEYAGDTAYNWGCDFCIPAYDAELADMIRRWNSPGEALNPGAMKAISAITNRVEQLGGIWFLWYQGGQQKCTINLTSTATTKRYFTLMIGRLLLD